MLLALRVALSVLALAVAAPAVAAEPSTVTIPVILSLSGPGAFLGKEEAQSFQALEASVNSHGGIRGAKVHFDVADDQTSPQVAVQLATSILAQKPPVVLGSDVVGTCAALTPLVKNGPLDYCFSPGLHPEAGSFQFSAGVSTNDIMVVALRYFRLHGWKRIALMTSTDATGADAERAFDAAIARPENHELTRVVNEHFAPADVSVAAQITRVKAADPQAFVLFTTGSPFGTVLRSMTDAGLGVPTVTSTGNMTYAQMSQYAQFDLRNVYFVGFRYFDRARIGRGPLRDDVDRFFDAFSAIGVKPDVGQGYAWDPGVLVIEALRALGPGATGERVRDWIAKQHAFIGVNGIYDFADVPQRGLNDLAAVVARWDPERKEFAVVSRPGGTPR